MGNRDCVFLVGYFMAFVSFFIFIASFGTAEWIVYEQGKRGLWKECTHSNDSSNAQDNCATTVLAEGPAFLDASRTLICFALAFYVLAIYGYLCAEKGKEEHTIKGQAKSRIQEISFFVAGVLSGIGYIVYGYEYYDYHSKELQLKDLELGFVFYMGSVDAGLTIVASLMLACSRDTGFKKTLTKRTRSFKLIKAPDKPQANKRNIWLKNKSVPTPLDQKDKKVVVIEEEKKEVPIKTNNLARFILPVTVIQAVRRLKNGTSRDEDEKASDLEKGQMENNDQKQVTMNLNTNSKYKGIFTINVDNRDEPNPQPAKVTPEAHLYKPQATDSTSSESDSYTSTTDSESSDSEIDVKVKGHTVPMADKARGKSDQTHTKGQTSSSTGIQERPKARRSATTLGKGEEPEWTRHTTLQTPQRPVPPRKMLSQGPHQSGSLRKAVAVPEDAIPESNVNIYTLPSEPGAVPPTSFIDYEEVLVRREGGYSHEPQPVITSQSQIYRPYSS